jgi:hypothetical protein
MKKLGLAIRKRRESMGLTLEAVEDHGYNFWQHWQQVEGGEKNITFITVVNICKVLGIYPSELLEEVDF